MSRADPQDRVARFGAALGALDAEIDWDVIASVVCEGEAEGFFSDERREAMLDAGLKHAADVGEALESLRGPERSLYVGASVAELAPIAFEAIVLGRKVRWVTLDGPDTAELARAFAAVDGALPKPHIGRWAPDEIGRVSHVWMASVLTDPDAFPALHDELYARRGTKAAVGGGRPKAERRTARDLVDRCLDALASPSALVTTSAEELAVWEPAIEARGWRAEAAVKGRLSGLVGDVLHQVRVTR